MSEYTWIKHINGPLQEPLASPVSRTLSYHSDPLGVPLYNRDTENLGIWHLPHVLRGHVTQPKRAGVPPHEPMNGNSTRKTFLLPSSHQGPVPRCGFSVNLVWRHPSRPSRNTCGMTSHVSCELSESSRQHGNLSSCICLPTCATTSPFPSLSPGIDLVALTSAYWSL